MKIEKRELSETSHCLVIEETDNNTLGCRGRNGFFKHFQTVVLSFPKVSHVEVYSKRKGFTAPIRFYGDTKNMKKYFQAIADSL